MKEYLRQIQWYLGANTVVVGANLVLFWATTMVFGGKYSGIWTKKVVVGGTYRGFLGKYSGIRGQIYYFLC